MYLTSTSTRLSRQIPRLSIHLRCVSTLSNNPHIHVFQNPTGGSSHLLSLLPTDPPNAALAIGTTSRLPPSASSFSANPDFLPILHSVIAEHAPSDPMVQSQAAVMISSSGANLFKPQRRQETGAFGASDQGGYGSANRGGWVHISDLRHIPDFGRIAEPEDIFGSVEVDGNGQFVDGTGRYQVSGTYRICTNDGILGLSDFMRGKLVERLKIEESAQKDRPEEAPNP